jgi:hypothetical protein
MGDRSMEDGGHQAAHASWDADLLIAGATFLGIGLALQHRQGALVAEREITVGHEFTYAYKHGERWNEKLRSEAANRFREELLQRNGMAEGRAHLPGLTPLLHRWIRGEGLPVRFMTEIVSVALENEGFTVALYDPSGHRTIRVRRIVDTTSTCVTKPGFAKPKSKRINALLHRTVPDVAGPQHRIKECGFRLEPGRFASEAYLSVPVQLQDDWTAAREKLHAFWANRPEPLQGWSLATVADQFELEVPEGPHEIDAGWIWQPSGAYPNPLAAMDAAVQAAVREEAI